MPRYFFNIYDGSNVRDDEGTELADAEVAKVEAIRHAGTLIAENANWIRVNQDWRLDVTDEAGMILYRLGFYVGSTAATMHIGDRRKPNPSA